MSQDYDDEYDDCYDPDPAELIMEPFSPKDGGAVKFTARIGERVAVFTYATHRLSWHVDAIADGSRKEPTHFPLKRLDGVPVDDCGVPPEDAPAPEPTSEIIKCGQCTTYFAVPKGSHYTTVHYCWPAKSHVYMTSNGG